MRKILFQKYEVLRLIAEGGMGNVYLVKDLHLNRLAAVKISKCEEREFAYGEMEVLKSLSHPALPVIIDFFEEEGSFCIVMEYVEGITLEQYLRKFGKTETRQAVLWGAELADVLGYLHKQKPAIIYRDLKPSNIMVQPNGSLKLIDFGAAFVSVYGKERGQLLMGTPGYSAPEQWHGQSACKESDIYGVGAVLHELLTGISPLGCNRQRRPVREYDKSISRELEKIIITCTREKAVERYHSMDRLKEALLNYQRKGKGREALYYLKYVIGIVLWGIVLARFFLPFLKGVSEAEFPFPYLKQPLFFLVAAVFYQLIFFRNSGKRKIVQKQEKSIFLTEKSFTGLYLPMFLLICLLTTLLAGNCRIPLTQAAEKAEVLWVEMRDEKYRKLLLKEDVAYQMKDSVRFEIAKEDLPEGRVKLQIVAVSEEDTSVYESRRFLVENN